jgi:endonuclease/exonuclease/phosphatase family metal-dependent hydrolase
VEPPKPAAKKPPAPEIQLTIASINLSKLGKRIELDDIRQFALELRKDSIDVLSVEGVSRYPGVETRIDVVDELSRAAEMRNAFGETIALSGRQSGNAIFSAFPITSSQNTPYDRITSTNFEAALQAVIDCGARELVVVSTLLPERASANDLNVCADGLSSLAVTYAGRPMIIAGNLPRSDVLRRVANFDAARIMKEDAFQQYWYSADGSLRLGPQRVVRTGLGLLSIAQFEIYKKSPQ